LNIFFDTEFTDLDKNAELISLGCISENNDTFYAEFYYDESKTSEWVKKNVIPNLLFNDIAETLIRETKPNKLVYELKAGKETVCKSLQKWLMKIGYVGVNHKFWADFPVFDWIMFTDLFGGIDKFPDFILSRPLDISVLFEIATGDCTQNRERFVGANKDEAHNALFDAKVLKKCYDKLMAE